MGEEDFRSRDLTPQEIARNCDYEVCGFCPEDPYIDLFGCFSAVFCPNSAGMQFEVEYAGKTIHVVNDECLNFPQARQYCCENFGGGTIALV